MYSYIAIDTWHYAINQVMTAVRNKGRLLEHDEEVTNAH